MIAYELRAIGFVQGVGFRAWAASRARMHHISGWVRNERDGSVALFAEGNDSDLNDYISALKAGNGLSRIDALEIKKAEPSGSAHFVIN